MSKIKSSELRRVNLMSVFKNNNYINNGNLTRMISEEASTKLGYKFMSSQYRGAENISRFEMALCNLNIKPFLPEDVKKYKDLRDGGRVGELYKQYDLDQFLLRFIILGMFMVVPLILLFAASMAISPKIIDYKGIYFGSVGFIFVATFICLSFAKSKYNKGWRSIEIQHYCSEIPESIFAQATEIKDIFPEVIFLIEELLEDHSYASSKKEDKILVAVVGEKEYYIDIWDEPKINQ